MGGIQVTDFQAKVLKLWDAGRDTLQITEALRRNRTEPLSEAQVYRALNAARVERRVYAEKEAS